MLTHEQRQSLLPRVRALQMVVLVLVGGVLVFAVVAYGIATGQVAEAPFALPPMHGYSALGVAAMAFFAAPLIGGVLASVQRRSVLLHASASAPDSAASFGPADGAVTRRPGATSRLVNDPLAGLDVRRLFQGYFVKTLVMAAIYEGAAFLNLVACLGGVELLNMAAVGVLVVGMLAQIPTLPQAEAWIECEIRQIRSTV